nr:spore cortex biosynthesis protein YabQ [Paenisporosarcina indica]
MIASGVATGFLVESFRDGCRALRPRAFLRRYQGFFEILLWLILGFASFYLLFYLRDGSWRIYDPCAQVVGIILYELWFRRPMLAGRHVFFRIVVFPIWWIIKLVFSILRQIFRIIVNIFLVLMWPFIKVTQKIAKKIPKIPRKPLKKT